MSNRAFAENVHRPHTIAPIAKEPYVTIDTYKNVPLFVEQQPTVFKWDIQLNIDLV